MAFLIGIVMITASVLVMRKAVEITQLEANAQLNSMSDLANNRAMNPRPYQVTQ